MRRNLDLTGGLLVSESVAMALAEKIGHGRAHAMVERASNVATASKISLREALLSDAEIARQYDAPTLDALLDPGSYLGESGAVVDRVLTRATGSSARP
jgi:3-carboxy-cis,cis-muconate cycloisomerase